MWAVITTPPSPACRSLLNSTRPPLKPPVLAVSAESQPRRSDAESTTIDSGSSVKGLGRTILSAVKSTTPKFPNPNPKQRTRNQEKQKQESEVGAAQISGSDVLWALQKAAAVKKEKNKNRQMKEKKKGGPSTTKGSDTEKPGIDHRVRPLRIKRDWCLRLSELEKRLQEFSETI